MRSYDSAVIQINKCVNIYALYLKAVQYHSYTLPDVFITYFTQISSVHNYNTSGKRNLYFTTTETGKKALTHKGCILWNKLPEGLKTIKSVAVLNIELEIILFLII